jgi:hypothetical protein
LSDVSVKDAAVRRGFYRRERPDGTAIDDVAWMLSQLESNTLPTRFRVRESWPLSRDEKSKLTELRSGEREAAAESLAELLRA